MEKWNRGSERTGSVRFREVRRGSERFGEVRRKKIEKRRKKIEKKRKRDKEKGKAPFGQILNTICIL